MHFYLLILGLLILDQVVKIIVRQTMTLGQSIPLIPGVFQLTYVENPGAAFGMLANQRFFFIVITVAILGIFFYLYTQLANKKSVAAVALALSISGAIGNFIDRLFRGTVTDLFDFCLISFPVFNIADICICLGIALIFYLLIVKGEDF